MAYYGHIPVVMGGGGGCMNERSFIPIVKILVQTWGYNF